MKNSKHLTFQKRKQNFNNLEYSAFRLIKRYKQMLLTLITIVYLSLKNKVQQWGITQDSNKLGLNYVETCTTIIHSG